jgi:hypothetical protein
MILPAAFMGSASAGAMMLRLLGVGGSQMMVIPLDTENHCSEIQAPLPRRFVLNRPKLPSVEVLPAAHILQVVMLRPN